MYQCITHVIDLTALVFESIRNYSKWESRMSNVKLSNFQYRIEFAVVISYATLLHNSNMKLLLIANVLTALLNFVLWLCPRYTPPPLPKSFSMWNLLFKFSAKPSIPLFSNFDLQCVIVTNWSLSNQRVKIRVEMLYSEPLNAQLKFWKKIFGLLRLTPTNLRGLGMTFDNS